MSFGSAPLGLILLGLTLGMRHATDPDHVIAVSAILTRERRLLNALRIGAVWGLGHSATVLAVGLAIVFFKLKMPVRLGLSFEFIVAIVMILLGLRAAKETLSLIAKKVLRASSAESVIMVHSHSHTHKQNDEPHTHRHLHAHSSVDDKNHTEHDHLMQPTIAETIAGRSTLKSFMVGLAHGLAGSAAIALLVTAAIPSPLWAMLYMTIFCCGAMLGMVLITTAIGTPLVFAAQHLAGVHRRLSAAAGLLSFGFGVFLAYQIAIGGQLFGSEPHWFPH